MKTLYNCTPAFALLVCLLLFVAPQTQAQNPPNGLVGLAHTAPGIAQCLAEAHSKYAVTSAISVSVDLNGNPTGFNVTFWGQAKCNNSNNPNLICLDFFIRVASVDFDLDGNITNSQCGGGIIIIP